MSSVKLDKQYMRKSNNYITGINDNLVFYHQISQLLINDIENILNNIDNPQQYPDMDISSYYRTLLDMRKASINSFIEGGE